MEEILQHPLKMQFIQFIRGSGALGECKGQVRPVTAKRAFLILHGVCRGSQRASQETQVYSDCETVSLVSPHSCLFYETCLKAGNISSALRHVLRKIRIGQSSPYPPGELKRHTLNPISGSADWSHCGGQTEHDRVMFWLQKRKRSKSVHDTPNKIPLLEDQATGSTAAFSYPWIFIFVLFST